MQEKNQGDDTLVDGLARRPHPAPRIPPATAPCAGHWERLLGDLACLGDVWLEVRGNAVVTVQRTGLSGLQVRDGLGHLSSADMSLRVLLDALQGAHTAANDTWTLALADLHGNRVASVRAARQNGGADLVWRALLAAPGAIGSGREPAAAPAVAMPLRDSHQRRVRELAWRMAGLADGIGFIDFAEVSGMLSLHRDRLRDRGHLIGVDPDLVPCLLSALVDHLAPLEATLGNAAMVQRLVFSPSAARMDAGSQYLCSKRTRVRLDFRAVDAAFVFEPAGRGIRELRLYDDDGRAVAIIGVPPDGLGREPVVWRTLIDALAS